MPEWVFPGAVSAAVWSTEYANKIHAVHHAKQCKVCYLPWLVVPWSTGPADVDGVLVVSATDQHHYSYKYT